MGFRPGVPTRIPGREDLFQIFAWADRLRFDLPTRQRAGPICNTFPDGYPLSNFSVFDSILKPFNH